MNGSITSSRPPIRPFFQSRIRRRLTYVAGFLVGVAGLGSIPKPMSEKNRQIFRQNAVQIRELAGRIRVSNWGGDPAYDGLAARGERFAQTYDNIANSGSVSTFRSFWFGREVSAWIDEAIRMAP